MTRNEMLALVEDVIETAQLAVPRWDSSDDAAFKAHATARDRLLAAIDSLGLPS